MRVTRAQCLLTVMQRGPNTAKYIQRSHKTIDIILHTILCADTPWAPLNTIMIFFEAPKNSLEYLQDSHLHLWNDADFFVATPVFLKVAILLCTKIYTSNWLNSRRQHRCDAITSKCSIVKRPVQLCRLPEGAKKATCWEYCHRRWPGPHYRFQIRRTPFHIPTIRAHLYSPGTAKNIKKSN